MPYIDSTLAAALNANSKRRSIIFRMESDPPLHFWSGIGDIVAPMRNVDVAGSTYIGGGQFAGLPELRQLINGLADRVEFSLSGVDEATAAKIEAETPSVKGSPIYVGILCFDEDWQPATEIVPLCILTADFTAIRQTPATAEEPARSEAILSAHYGDAGRKTPTLIHWTRPHQKLRDPDDISCNFVYRYQSNYDVAWPRG